MGDCTNGVRIRVSCSPGNTVTKNFHLTEVALNEGPSCVPFVRPSFVDELAKCRRYFFKTFNYSTTIGQAGGNTGAFAFTATKAGALAQNSGGLRYPVPLRFTPSITFFNPQNANANIFDSITAADSGAPTAAQSGFSGFNISFTGVAAGAVGNLLLVNVTADADF